MAFILLCLAASFIQHCICESQALIASNCGIFLLVTLSLPPVGIYHSLSIHSTVDDIWIVPSLKWPIWDPFLKHT